MNGNHSYALVPVTPAIMAAEEQPEPSIKVQVIITVLFIGFLVALPTIIDKLR
jgi:hypothetical protein